MKTIKKSYVTPQLIMHGTVADLTLHGGPPDVYDTPIGTPAADISTGSYV